MTIERDLIDDREKTMNFINNLTVKNKISFIGIGGFVAIFVFAFLSFAAFEKSLNYFDSIKENEVKLLKLSNEVKYNSSQVQQWLSDISATRGAEGFDDGFDEAKNFASLLEQNFNDLENLAKETNFKELLDDTKILRENFQKFYEVGQEMAKKYINDGPEVGNAFMLVFDEIANKMYESSDELMEMANNNYSGKMENFALMIQEYKFKIIFTALVLVILMILTIYFIVRDITNSLYHNCNVMSEISSKIASASAQISSASNSLAETSTTQAASIEEINATIINTISINQEDEKKVKEANQLSKETNLVAKEGNDKIQELIHSMNKTIQASQQSAKIVKTIDEIAFQINLLALNAAVEAARAGEHGLGFAVVADEVKNLATRSAKASHETTDIIEKTINQIKEGSKITKDTNEVFKKILDKAEQTSTFIEQIAISTKEQLDKMEQIAKAINSVDEATQHNAAVSEQTAASANHLQIQSTEMLESVDGVSKKIGIKS